METKLARRTLLTASAAGLVAAAAPLRARAREAKKLKVALSNSFIGNKWRIEMENLFKAALQMEPYKSEVEGSWFNSGNNVTEESQQISGLIAERVDAIIMDAASPTGLNGIVEQAGKRGILVVSFDNVVTAPSSIRINFDQTVVGTKMAQFLVEKLNGHGNVIMVTGVPGTYDDSARNKAADAVWKQHPGIKVVGDYTGMWDSATAQRNTAAILPSLPKVDGIWCQAGADGVLKAFIDAKRVPLPPTAGEAGNGLRKFMSPEGYMGQHVDGISIGTPPYLVLVALEMARRILQKTYPRKDITVPPPVVTNDMIKVGETVFPDLPDSFFADFTDFGPNATLKICVDAALKGTPCPGRLVVHLPKV
ncbi:MAG: sugar ABC transporter substrate-binding protein [Acetobacteraceae bacterium]